MCTKLLNIYDFYDKPLIRRPRLNFWENFSFTAVLLREFYESNSYLCDFTFNFGSLFVLMLVILISL